MSINRNKFWLPALIFVIVFLYSSKFSLISAPAKMGLHSAAASSSGSIIVRKIMVGDNILGCSAIDKAEKTPLVFTLFKDGNSTMSIPGDMYNVNSSKNTARVDLRVGDLKSISEQASVDGNIVTFNLMNNEINSVVKGISVNGILVDSRKVLSLLNAVRGCTK